MPELPEVETIRRALASRITGKKFQRIVVDVPKMIQPLSVPALQRRLRGKQVTALHRRAKLLLISLSDNQTLAIHLKLSGQLIFQPKAGLLVIGGHPQPGGLDNLPNKFTHIIFHFTDGSVLYFNDQRKFGWARLLDIDQTARQIVDFGVDPLSSVFSLKHFTKVLRWYPNRAIKQTLLDQKLFAGIGNIYADESCFYAGVRPSRLVKSLTLAEIKKLHAGIPKILHQSITKGGTSFALYRQADGTKGSFLPFLNVYGRQGLPCKRCGTPIKKTLVAQRGTSFCPTCQK
jgi:formamidopyrimidine-DNA glycosylase